MTVPALAVTCGEQGETIRPMTEVSGALSDLRNSNDQSVDRPSIRHLATALILLWLAGNALRLPILAVPPVLVAVQAELKMSGTEVGILSGLPVVLFALAALPGSLLIARIGAVPALMVGLTSAAAGSGLRAIAHSVAVLYVTTIVMGGGIAVMQPAIPAVVRQWLPHRIGLATAVFTNGLIIGEALAVALTSPVVLPLAQGNWRWALGFWSVPLLAIAALLAFLAPRDQAVAIDRPHRQAHWRPDLGDPMVWRLGLILGSATTVYFGSNAFLPGHLNGAGRADLIAAALTGLNLGQLPASFLLLAFAERLERRAWPMIMFGVGSVVSVIGAALSASAWTVVFASLLGFCAGGTLVFSLALPALLRAAADVAPTSAAMFMIGYAEAVVAAVIAGAVWDVFGSATFALLPLSLCALPLVFLPSAIRFERND